MSHLTRAVSALTFSGVMTFTGITRHKHVSNARDENFAPPRESQDLERWRQAFAWPAANFGLSKQGVPFTLRHVDEIPRTWEFRHLASKQNLQTKELFKLWSKRGFIRYKNKRDGKAWQKLRQYWLTNVGSIFNRIDRVEHRTVKKGDIRFDLRLRHLGVAGSGSIEPALLLACRVKDVMLCSSPTWNR
ncbi:hypothetical protein RRG08_058979 [Elysia crispata]|uniref:Uncharacterized protein n=1 Tax=Elysia crispata TaxID=231223 RepID=A0AAE1AXC8_9GAST|nr:hypothetical protein RRG08_058979 [Elysia crispata]